MVLITLVECDKLIGVGVIRFERRKEVTYLRYVD